MGAIAYTVVADPQQAAPVIAAVASLGTIWTVGLSVLGIYVYRRSGEKQRVLEAQGGLPANQNTGVLQNLLQSLIKSKSKEM